MSASESLRVTLISPFHGGSHKYWADGLIKHSRHDYTVLSLPDKHWRWRMHGSAHALSAQFAETAPPDVILATDMLDLATFIGLTRTRARVVLYLHENQLTYPLPPSSGKTATADRHCGLINLNAVAAADLAVFNSAYHRDAWFDALPDFFDRFPETPVIDVDALRAKSRVIHVGIELDDLPEPSDAPREPLVVWNQRWEHDKNPLGALEILRRVADRGIDFQVALCGEQPAGVPAEMAESIAALGDRVVHQGFLPRPQYTELLGRARLVLSTAHHEFFGISVAEAVCAGAYPILPRRLSYPEVLGPDSPTACFYSNSDEAVVQLATAVADPDPTRPTATTLVSDLQDRFSWPTLAAAYDDALADEEFARAK